MKPDPSNTLGRTRRRIFWALGVGLTGWTLLNLWGYWAWQDHLSQPKLSWDIAGHGVLWLAGLIGIAWAGERILRFLEEQQQTSQALRLSEARYRQVVELSPAGIAIHQEGEIVFVNPAVRTMLGVNAPEALLGQPMMSFVHPDSQPLVRERVAQMMRSGLPAPLADEKLIRPDGSVVEVRLASAPMIYNGKPAFQVLIYDQTREKRLERALQFIEKGVSARMGQDFFQSAVTQLAGALAADVVFIGEYLPQTERVRTLAVCADGSPAPNFDYVLAGAPCANVINRDLCCYPSGVADLFPLDEGLRTLQAEGYLGMPLWTAERAPSGLLVALYRRPIADPEFARSVVQIFASRLEVEMERDRILRDLRESQARLTAIFENIPFDLWLADSEDRTILQNPVSLALWGNHIGQQLDEIQDVPEALKAVWRDQNRRVLQGEAVRGNQTLQRNDQVYYLESFEAPVRTDGKIIGYVGANIDVTQQKQTEQQLRQALEHITRLRAMDQTILAGADTRSVLNVLCLQIAGLLQSGGIEVLQYHPATSRLEVLARHGLRAYSLFSSFPISQDIAYPAVLENKIVYERDFATYLQKFPACADLAQEGFSGYAALPLIAKGVTLGALEFFLHAEQTINPDWWELAQTIANQIALALDNFTLFDSLQRSNAELSLAYDLTLEGWSKALELRDYETEGHTQRVTQLTVNLAEFMGVAREQLIHFRRGAILHDIGKIGIPDAILHKPGPLTESEWEIVRQHPRFAYDLLLPIPFLRPALEIPLYHHERWNGSGYPEALQGEKIPLAARIFAVADVYDALVSARPYHEPMTPPEALAYLRKNCAIQFDPKIIRAFFQLQKEPW